MHRYVTSYLKTVPSLCMLKGCVEERHEADCFIDCMPIKVKYIVFLFPHCYPQTIKNPSVSHSATLGHMLLHHHEHTLEFILTDTHSRAINSFVILTAIRV